MSLQENRGARLWIEELEPRDAPAYLVSAPGAFSVAGLDFPGLDDGWNVQCQINMSTGQFFAPDGSPQIANLDQYGEILGPTQSPNEQDFQLLVNEFPGWNFIESPVQLADNSLQIKDYEALAPGSGAPAGNVGASLLLQYIPSGVDPANIDWIQSALILDNAAANGASPFYNRGGCTADDTGFYDLPSRFITNDPIQWRADLFVAQELAPCNGVRNVVIWGGVSWGWHTARTQAAPVVSVFSSADPSIAGAPLTLTATVTAGSADGSIPTGTVDFYSDGEFLGTGTLDESGTASFDAPNLPAGTHTITAVYSGNENYTSSQASTDQTVTDVMDPVASQAANPTLGLVTLDNQTNYAGDTVNLALMAPGTDGSALTFVATGLPLGLNLGADGTISGVIDASAGSSTSTVVVTALDASTNITVTQTFTWTVV
jgi:hypothetical protein